MLIILADVALVNGEVSLNRHNIITSQDVYNIVVQFGIRKDRYDNDDAVSVELMVEEDKTKEFKNFFCYQRQDDSGVFTLGK